MNTINTKYLEVTEPVNVSPKYRFVSTAEFVQDVEAQGFKLTKLQGRSPKGTGKHLMVFERDDLKLLNGDKIQLLAYTSHDGTSSFKLFLGYYRLVCSNGLMVGTTLEEYRVTHVGYAAQKVQRAIYNCLQSVEQLKRQVQDAHISRLGILDQTRIASIVAAEVGASCALDLVTSHRGADNEDTAWNVMNRIQENVIQGNFGRKDAEGRLTKARRVTGAASLVKLNRFIWDTVLKAA